MTGRVLVALAWAALAGGLLWTGKIRGAEEPEAPPALPLTRLELDALTPAEAVLEAAADGSAPLRVALTVESLRDAEASRELLGPGAPDGALRYRVDEVGGAAAPAVRLRFEDLAQVESLQQGDRSLLVVHRDEIAVTGGHRYRITAGTEGDDALLLALRPLLLIGEARDDTPIPVARDARPGLLLLLGLAGVLVHLTMTIGRLVVPEQPALPAEA